MQYFCILFKTASEDAAAANGLPLEEKSLSEILGTDEDGSTTLYDDQNCVISTNYPTLAQDSFYLGGGTLDLGTAVYVRFRMAEILPQHVGGVQENVTYCTDTLPQELVPTETDREGNEILNAADKKEPVRMKLRTGSFLLAFAVSQGVSAVLHSIRHPTPAWPHRRSLWHPSHRSLPRSPWHNPGSAPRRPP